MSTLATIMQDAAQPPQARVAAARELLDRGYGKSKDTLELIQDRTPPMLVVDLLTKVDVERERRLRDDTK